ERMAEHQPLHFSVVGAAPVRPGQERPADLDLTLLVVVAVESRGPDNADVLAVDGDQRATGFEGFAKEGREILLSVSIFAGMLFPNERVGSHRVEVAEILRAERSEFEEVALQARLEVEWHTSAPR